MTLSRIKLGCAVTFMKHPASVVSLIVLQETLIWNNHVSAIKFTEFCRAGG